LAYLTLLEARGGTPPYRWSITEGALPAGMTLNPDGLLSGTPREVYSGVLTIQAADSDSATAQARLTLTIALPAIAKLLLTSLPDPLSPASQVPLTVALEQPAVLPMTGTLSLDFTAERLGRDDSAIALLASGGSSRSLSFTVPQGSKTARFENNAPVTLQTGTSSGSVALTASLTVPGTTPVSTSARSRVSSLAPVISSARLVRRDAYLIEIEVAGYSTTGEIHTAAFTFASTGQLPPPQTLDVRGLFDTWYFSAAGRTEGGTYKYTQRFNFTANADGINTIGITLTNSIGPSEPFKLALTQ
jgi:hypothetical protein